MFADRGQFVTERIFSPFHARRQCQWSMEPASYADLSRFSLSAE